MKTTLLEVPSFLSCTWTSFHIFCIVSFENLPTFFTSLVFFFTINKTHWYTRDLINYLMRIHIVRLIIMSFFSNVNAVPLKSLACFLVLRHQQYNDVATCKENGRLVSINFMCFYNLIITWTSVTCLLTNYIYNFQIEMHLSIS